MKNKYTHSLWLPIVSGGREEEKKGVKTLREERERKRKRGKKVMNTHRKKRE